MNLPNLGQLGTAGFGSAAIVVQVLRAASGAGAYHFVAAIDITGTEVEGGSAGLAVRTDADGFLAYNIGASIPPVGKKLIADQIDGYWIICYDG